MANPDLIWYKWLSSRSRNSARWQSLTYEQRGIFHELYAVASLQNPRGRISSPDGVTLVTILRNFLAIDEGRLSDALATLEARGLLTLSPQVLTFPDFTTHQRGTPARVRHNSGTKVVQKWYNDGTQEEEEEREVEKEEEQRQEQPSSLMQKIADHCFIGTWRSTDEVAVTKTIADYGEGLVSESFDILVREQKHSWSYLLGILRRLHADRAKGDEGKSEFMRRLQEAGGCES